MVLPFLCEGLWAIHLIFFIFFFVLFCFCFVEIAQVGLELTVILLPLCPECWDWVTTCFTGDELRPIDAQSFSQSQPSGKEPKSVGP